MTNFELIQGEFGTARANELENLKLTPGVIESIKDEQQILLMIRIMRENNGDNRIQTSTYVQLMKELNYRLKTYYDSNEIYQLCREQFR